MFLSHFKPPLYTVIPLSERNDNHDVEEDSSPDRKESDRLHMVGSLILLGLLCIIAGWVVSQLMQDRVIINQLSRARMSNCENPTTRREWRSLSKREKNQYISAVQCLLSKPSRTRTDGVLYEDFPYIHAEVGGYSHNAAAFLPWHRYLLHIYETELRATCNYTGSLTYWDWSLDWESLATSPVFSSTTGFGGNGDPNGPHSVGEGHCVTDGPFLNLTLQFYNSDDHPHCLSRGFTDGHVEGRLPGDKVQPAAIEEILRQSNFESFFMKLEKGPHNQIPNGINGDFIKFTAPNDPIFFLHHSQLDRLWWMWQQRDWQTRVNSYSGIAQHNSSVPASITDPIPMGDLAPTIHVLDVMDTESGFLCYRY